MLDAPKKRFYGDQNAATRIDLFDELSEYAQSALREFFRRTSAPHLYEEVVIPLLAEGDSQIFAAVRDRPWPPWGLGARHISAVCQTHLISDLTFGISPIYVADENLSNIGLIAAVFKEAVEYLAFSMEGAEIHYLIADGSTLADHVFKKVGFEPTEDVFLTETARYYTYRIKATELLRGLGLDGISTPDLLAHEVETKTLEQNALFHSTLYLASRAEWTVSSALVPSEIARLVRGAHYSKPGGVPTGTGRIDMGDPWPDEAIFVGIENFFAEDENRSLIEYVLSQEANFRVATVVERGAEKPTVNERIRRAKTLDDLGRFDRLVAERIKENLAEVLTRLSYDAFPLGEIEIQVAAIGHGDYFRLHRDSDEQDNREITFVYFFFNEPKRFSGGELRIFETELVNGRLLPTDRQQTIAPRQNFAIFFPSRHEHEVMPTRVPSKLFTDSRFTVTAWLHRG